MQGRCTLPGAPPGPNNAAEALLWAQSDIDGLASMGKQFFGCDFTERLFQVFKIGFTMSTDYSGMGGPEVGLNEICQAASFGRQGSQC